MPMPKESRGRRWGAALLLAPGFLALGFDAAVSHLADKPMTDPFQLAPLLLAPLGVGACLAFALLGPRPFARAALQVAGALALVVGAAGTFFHLKAMLFHLQGTWRTLGELQESLAVSPPAFAPGGYVLLGAATVFLASRRLSLRIARDVPAREPAAPTAPRRAA